jgi:alpha-L-rhamnosidase
MTVRVENVRFEHHREPFGIGEATPRISWQVAGGEPGWRQRAFEVAVSAAEGGSAESWQSGRIDSPESVLVDWPCEPLRSRERRSVCVRVWGDGAEPSPWSEPAPVEAGLLAAADWRAVLVAPDRDLGGRLDRPPVLVRRPFDVSGEVASARLYISAHGMYEARINGQLVGDHVFAPGWTSYRHRLRYQTFDVTALIRPGRNAIGATVAEGWYCGHLGFHGGRRLIWGDEVALLAQLEITCADGHVEALETDGAWRWADGPTLSSGIYAGEDYDARREIAGWSGPDFEDASWRPVRELGPEPAALVAPSGPPVRRTQTLAPASIFTTPRGQAVVDFGQNLVGRVRLRVRGEAGLTVVLRHGEVLEEGEVATRPLRGAAAVDRYTLRGGETEEWEPAFTYHGFRYVEIGGWPGSGLPEPDDVRAVVLHTDMARTGWFDSSDPLLDRFHENVVWTLRGNFMDVPTDCPQRDERLGWTGDLGVFAPTASFLYDCSGTLRTWLTDIAVEQAAWGTVPLYVPWFGLSFPLAPVAVWGDAAVVVPWILYERFGDLGVLRDQYQSMKAWVDQVAGVTGPRHLWTTGIQLGDWLDPAAPADAPEIAQTDRYLVATAYHALAAQLLADAARLLGDLPDATAYDELAKAVREAFRAEYTSPNGRLVCDAQTAYALALEFGLLAPSQRERAGRRLIELAIANGHHAGTGFVGSRLVCDALVHAGSPETAYHMLMQRECPSWLYPVTMGATTVWERWDSMLPDGRLNPGDMLSFNHYALGAIADWLHRTVGGLAPAEPGYRRILVAPIPGGGLEWATTAHETPYGRAEVAWKRADGRLEVDIQVPTGSTALVRLPDPVWEEVEVGPGRHRFGCPYRSAAEDPLRPSPPPPLGLPPEGDGGVFDA